MTRLATPPILMVMLIKHDGERYVFQYTHENRGEVLRRFGEFASNPDLSFSWYDAAIGDWLPPGARDLWAAAHIAAKEAIGKAEIAGAP